LRRNKSAYFFSDLCLFFRTFAYFFGELAVFSKKIELAPSEKIPVGNPQALFSDLRPIPEGELAPPYFFFTPRIVQPLRDFFRRKKYEVAPYTVK
jgi:hypothetical protein